MGLDGEFVITVNAELLDVSAYVNTDDIAMNYIADRASRLSVALNDNGSGSTDFSTYDYYGAIEGNFSKLLVNTALSFSKAFTKSKDGETKLKFFVEQSTGLEAAIPMNGVILFSNRDVVENYSTTIVNRTNHIADEDAAKLSSSQIGIYVASPKVMMDFGIEIPQAALDNISNVLLVMDDNVISVDFTLKSEALAKSFSVIIKAGYIAKLKLEGQSVNISELKLMFTQEFDKVCVNELKLTEEQLSSIKATVMGLLDMIG